MKKPSNIKSKNQPAYNSPLLDMLHNSDKSDFVHLYERETAQVKREFATAIVEAQDVVALLKLRENLGESLNQELYRDMIPMCFAQDKSVILQFLLPYIEPASQESFLWAALAQNAINICDYYLEKMDINEFHQWIKVNKPDYFKSDKATQFNNISAILDKKNLEKSLPVGKLPNDAGNSNTVFKL